MNAHSQQQFDMSTPAQDSRPTAVRFVNVSKTYAARHGAPSVAALRDASFDIPVGSIAGIIGRSGAGKSTLVRLVNGLERPSAGQVLVAGADFGALDGEALRVQQRRIGMVFQHFNLLSSRTAFGNIALPLEFAGADRARIDKRVEELLALVGLVDKRNAYPAELSGGQKQRVGIARALAMQPDILLCDEATSALDPETTQSILDLLRDVNRLTGVTILMITHEMHVVKAVADQLIVLDGGRVAEAGETYAIFTKPHSAIARGFIDTISGALPESVRTRLQEQPGRGAAGVAAQALLRIVFAGPNAERPVLSQLSRQLGLDLEIVAGQIDRVAGHPFGVLIVAAPGATETLGTLQAALSALDLHSEILGYVA